MIDYIKTAHIKSVAITSLTALLMSGGCTTKTKVEPGQTSQKVTQVVQTQQSDMMRDDCYYDKKPRKRNEVTNPPDERWVVGVTFTSSGGLAALFPKKNGQLERDLQSAKTIKDWQDVINT